MTSIKIYDTEFNIAFVQLLAPILLCFSIFKWLMLSKRRRDLLVGLQLSCHTIFQIDLTEKEMFPNFNPNVLNLIPFSLLSEISTIEKESKVNLWMTRIGICLIGLLLTSTIIYSLWQLMNVYNLRLTFIWPGSMNIFINDIVSDATIIVSLFFIIWTFYYYHVEVREQKEINATLKKQNKVLNTQTV